MFGEARVTRACKLRPRAGRRWTGSIPLIPRRESAMGWRRGEGESGGAAITRVIQRRLWLRRKSRCIISLREISRRPPPSPRASRRRNVRARNAGECLSIARKRDKIIPREREGDEKGDTSSVIRGVPSKTRAEVAGGGECGVSILPSAASLEIELSTMKKAASFYSRTCSLSLSHTHTHTHNHANHVVPPRLRHEAKEEREEKGGKERERQRKDRRRSPFPFLYLLSF